VLKKKHRFAEQSPRLFEADDLPAQRPAPVKTYTLPSEGGAAPGSGPASAAAPASHGKLRDVMHPLPPPIEADAGLHDPHEAQFALSDMFKLPANFGTIYLGETFSSYICVNNEAMVNVRDVSVKAELQVLVLLTWGRGGLIVLHSLDDVAALCARRFVGKAKARNAPGRPDRRRCDSRDQGSFVPAQKEITLPPPPPKKRDLRNWECTFSFARSSTRPT